MDDIADLESINEGTFVETLLKRYGGQKFYTQVGPMCLFLNPQTKPGPYQYKSAVAKAAASSAHLFARVGKAIASVQDGKSDQCCVFSGEVGSGKTTSFTSALTHALYVGTEGKPGALGLKTLAALKVLRAFISAKNDINDQSTRGALLARVAFAGDDGHIVGVSFGCYLLEKSRLYSKNLNQGCFHVFYYLKHILSPQQRESYGIAQEGTFRLLFDKSPDLIDVDQPNASAWVESLKTLGFTDEDLNFIIRILCTIMHLSNLDVAPHPDGPSFGATVGQTVWSAKAQEVLPTLLEMDTTALLDRLTRTETSTPILEAQTNIYTLMTELFSALVSWMVVTINENLHGERSMSASNMLSFLDMFGFENQTSGNSLEQLLINIANERLHQVTISGLCEGPQQVFEEENIDYQRVPLDDNSFVIDLLLGDPGILSVLEAACDKDGPLFLDELNDKLSDNPLLVTEACGDQFSVLHYAGKVSYEVEGFVERNASASLNDVSKLFNESDCPITSTFLGSAASLPIGRRMTFARSRRHRGDVTTQVLSASTLFKRSLNSLLSEFSGRNLWVVRCLLPNRQKSSFPDEFIVRDQLRSNLLVETAQIFHRGYSISLHFEEFLAMLGETAEGNPRQLCQQLLSCLPEQDYSIGQSMVFLKPRAESKLYAEHPPVTTRRRSNYALWMQFEDAEEDSDDDTGYESPLRVSREESYQLGESSQLPFITAAEAAVAKILEADAFARAFPGTPAVSDQSLTTKRSRNLYELDYRMKALQTSAEKVHAIDCADTRHLRYNLHKSQLQKHLPGALNVIDASTCEVEVQQPPKASIKPLEEEIWYHGVLGRSDAEQRMAGTPYGSFLVRSSETRAAYALSVKLGNEVVKHYIIESEPDGKKYIVGKEMRFPSVQALVLHHRTRIVSSKGCELMHACIRPGAELPEEKEDDVPVTASSDAGSFYMEFDSTPVNEKVLREVHALAEHKQRHVSASSLTLDDVKAPGTDSPPLGAIAEGMPYKPRPEFQRRAYRAASTGGILDVEPEPVAPFQRSQSVPTRIKTASLSSSKIKTLSEDSLRDAMKELATEIDKESRIVDAAKRLAAIKAGNKKDQKKQKKLVEMSEKKLKELEATLKTCTDQLTRFIAQSNT